MLCLPHLVFNLVWVELASIELFREDIEVLIDEATKYHFGASIRQGGVIDLWIFFFELAQVLVCEHQVKAELAAPIQNFTNVFGDEVLEFIDEHVVRRPLPFSPGEGRSYQFVNQERTEQVTVIV
jgi:hypothetical protein